MSGMSTEKSNICGDKIKSVALQIMANKITTKPFDLLFRENITHFPKTNHKLLGLPGTFKNKEETKIFIKGCGNLEMDYLESVLPDEGMIKRESAINLEQETCPVKDEKAETIFNYCLNTIINLKKPCYTYVVTNNEYEKDYLTYCIEGFLLVIRLIIFGKERVYKILNRLKEKDYSKEEFSEEDYVLFVYCMVFAKKPYAQDIMEKLAKLFTSIDKIKIEYKQDLYVSLCMMIKYHFEDCEKIQELIIMMTENMQEEVIERLPTLEERKIELAKKDKELAEKDKEIAESKNTISEKNKEIARLEKLLLSNNIVF